MYALRIYATEFSFFEHIKAFSYMSISRQSALIPKVDKTHSLQIQEKPF